MIQVTMVLLITINKTYSMLIDKTVGRWCEETTKLDDVAYQLYVNMVLRLSAEYNQSYIINTQEDIIDSYNNWNAYRREYNNANIYLRKYKIKKILSRENR